MRPVCRGTVPAGLDIDKYEAAKADLVSRLGRYCSYCEREIATVLAVEHIQPKGLPDYQHLENEWTNFLLACVNCNSTKKDKDVVLSEVLFPDRDNTSHAFNYLDDGSIAINAALVGTPIEAKARSILKLTGLDKSYSQILDANGNAVALDRKAQRIEAFGEARVALSLFLANQTDEMITAIVMMAKARGYFSIWYQVFDAFPAVLIRLVQTFPALREVDVSACTTAVEYLLLLIQTACRMGHEFDRIDLTGTSVHFRLMGGRPLCISTELAIRSCRKSAIRPVHITICAGGKPEFERSALPFTRSSIGPEARLRRAGAHGK